MRGGAGRRPGETVNCQLALWRLTWKREKQHREMDQEPIGSECVKNDKDLG